MGCGIRYPSKWPLCVHRQIAVGATIDAVDKIPIINKGLQLIGVAVTTLFFYRYFTDPAER